MSNVYNMNTVKLNNGVEMPQVGYGVFQVSPAECERCVADALKVGYRMVDTALAYHNEEGVGNAVRKSGIPRSDIFLVSKVWISNLWLKVKMAFSPILSSLASGKSTVIQSLRWPCVGCFSAAS